MRRMCVIVPFMVASGLMPDASRAGGAPACPSEAGGGKVTVNINSADAATLDERLKGVGRSKAEAIVQWRQAHGPFRSLEQLDEVKGIGPGILEKNRDRIVFRD